MDIIANNPQRKSWLQYDKNSDFPIQNIPFGVFITKDDIITIGTRIGEYAIDLAAFHQLGYFEGIPLTDDMFMQDSLNDFIADGRKTWRLVRNRIAEVFDIDNPSLRDHKSNREAIIFDVDEIEMLMPIDVGDYTDFYSSKEHASNNSKMFLENESELSPSWYQVPKAYHGRSSSIVVSGTKIYRPHGQLMKNGDNNPVFGSSEYLDLEMETAFITTDANHLGQAIPVDEAEDYIFGMVILNDWSARDILKWEYVPLGPFLGKNFACSISAWIVTMDALEPFRCENKKQEVNIFPYLQQKKSNSSYDIKLNFFIETKDKVLTKISESNFKNLYWSMSQQLAHHTVNGCNVRAGDLMASGSISGKLPENYSSLLELTNVGKNPITLNDGTTRTFLQDGDNVIIRGYCKNDSVRIGFGKCTGQIFNSY